MRARVLLERRRAVLGRFLRGGERILALFQFGDVAIDREQAAVIERLEVEFDELAARGTAFVARARSA